MNALSEVMTMQNTIRLSVSRSREAAGHRDVIFGRCLLTGNTELQYCLAGQLSYYVRWEEGTGFLLLEVEAGRLVIMSLVAPARQKNLSSE